MQTSPSRPRILLVSNGTVFGGAEIHYTKLAKLLLEHYEVAAVACNPMLQNRFESMEISTWHVEATRSTSRLRRYFITTRALTHAIRDYRPQLIHLNGGSTVYLAVILRLFKIPTLITYHTYTEPTEAAYRKLLLKLAARSAKRVVCVSNAVRDNWREVLGVTNTIVISNWISPMPPVVAHRMYDGKRPLSLLYVGRLEREKGIFDLLQAMKHLENVHLDVVGDGSCMAEIISRSAGLPVTLHGFKEDVTNFYKRADLFVLPSLSEGQSLVLMEAMTWGVPCLISDLPAPVETAGNGEFATTYRAGDPGDLVSKIRSFQESPARFAALSGKGRNFARAMYAEERIRPIYLNLLRSILPASAGVTRHDGK